MMAELDEKRKTTHHYYMTSVSGERKANYQVLHKHVILNYITLHHIVLFARGI